MVTPTLLAERYRIDRQVGIGGMGTVFAATDERLGRSVAVKVLKEELSSDPKFVERFRREARAAAALSHPNIANVFDYGEDGSRYFIVMELVEGRDLSRVMREEGPLEASRALNLVEQMALALGHAHSAGLIHRDVKPANAIVMDGDRIKVTDFGIARATGESTLTATGAIMGTAQYVSPEQASGETPGPPSDVYSLGVVLFEMVTGAVPFTGDSPISVALRHVREEVPPPSSIDPEIPARVDEIVAAATAKQPDDRLADGNAFAAAVRGESPSAPTTAVMAPSAAAAWPFANPPRWDTARLGRTVVLVFGLLFLIALAALAFRLASTDIPDRRTGDLTSGDRTPDQTPAVGTLVLDDYRGLSAEAAGKGAKADGLQAYFSSGTCEQRFGHVCEQTPDPGETVREGSAVTLVINAIAGNDKDDEADEDEEPGVGKKDKVPPGKEKKDKDD